MSIKDLFGIKIFTRACHDCGRKTTDYRCSSCLAKWRAEHKIQENGEEYLPSCRAKSSKAKPIN